MIGVWSGESMTRKGAVNPIQEMHLPNAAAGLPPSSESSKFVHFPLKFKDTHLYISNMSWLFKMHESKTEIWPHFNVQQAFHAFRTLFRTMSLTPRLLVVYAQCLPKVAQKATSSSTFILYFGRRVLKLMPSQEKHRTAKQKPQSEACRWKNMHT